MSPSALVLLGAFVLVASFGWFVIGTRDMALIDRDEPMIAEVARQMVHRGEWLTPHLPAWPDKSIFKPPLAMWVMAGSFKLLGVSEFAARLPSGIGSALTATLLFAVAGRRWGRSAGLVAAACMVAPLLPTVVGHLALTDSMLTLLATIILLCLDRSLRSGGSLACNVTMWMAAGAAMLIKGPAILAFLGPALVIAADGFRWRRYIMFSGGILLLVLAGGLGLSERHIPALVLGGAGALIVAYGLGRWLAPLLRLPVGIAWGVPVMLAVCGWWFVYVAAAGGVHGGSAKRFILFEVLTRIAQPMEHHSGPPGYYLGILAVGLLPLTAGAAPLVAWSRRHLREDLTRSLLWAWAIGSWVLCEIASTKLPHYILPAVPALALLAAMGWRQADDADAPIGRRRAFGLVLPVLLFAAAVGTVALVAWQEGPRIRLVDPLLAGRPQITSRIAYLGKLLPWQVNCLSVAALLLVVTATAGFLVARRKGVRSGLLVQTCGWMPALLILVIAMTSASPFNESLSRQAARQAIAMGGEQTHYFAVGFTEPAVFFYLPADRYARVEKSALAELVDIDVPFVLIASRNLEADIRARFGPRIDRAEVVWGLNTAKATPGTVCVFRIIADTIDTKDPNALRGGASQF
jgi:4-amino-4-deoxy-L-arabinose transferase-like glycosyltransferase